MTIEEIRNAMPGFARDIKLNLDAVLKDDPGKSLSPSLRAAIALSSAHAARSPQLAQAIETAMASVLDEATREAAMAALAVMSMNNIYYRFVHLVGDKEYAKLPARLRMNALANPGIEKRDFELIALAISAVNGCGMCVESHEKVLRQAEVSVETVQEAVRIAAVIHAAAVLLESGISPSRQAAA